MKLSLVLVLLAAGCDAKATASDPQSDGKPEQKSKEYESCGATMHCSDELRCFDHVCQRPMRSTIGDYYAAAGRAALAQGDSKAAIGAYAKALAHYDTEKVALPPALDCEYGAALAAGRSDRESAELGARVLHRCLNGVPAASVWRTKAMQSLVLLGDSGLDPLLLGSNKLADMYLTKAPVKPAIDKLAVTVSAAPPLVKSMSLIEDKVAEADVKNALVACWETFHTQAKKDVMIVAIDMKGAFVRGEYEDDPVRFVLKIDPPVGLPAGTPDAGADRCVRAVLEPAIKSLKIAENFTTKLTISVK